MKAGILDPLTLLAAATAVLLPIVLPSTSLATEVLIFALATCGCNLLLGYTGLLSFGQGVFFAAGSYLSALALIHTGIGAISALVVGAVSGAAAAAIVGAFSIRKRGVYFVMLTLAFSQMSYFLVLTLKDYTGGENGLLNVPRAPVSLLGQSVVSIATTTQFYIFTAVLFVISFAFLRRVVLSRFGTVIVAIRENERRAEALGYNTFVYKLIAFTVSGLVTGLAGAIHALFLSYVPLNNVEFEMSERIVIMTILGGAGSLYGSVLGAICYVLAAEILSDIWPRWLMLIGFALIAVVIYVPGGLWGGVEAARDALRSRFGRHPALQLPGRD